MRAPALIDGSREALAVAVRLAGQRDVTVSFPSLPAYWQLQRGCGAAAVPIASCTSAEARRTYRDLIAGDYYLVVESTSVFTATPTVTTAATATRASGDVCATATPT